MGKHGASSRRAYVLAIFINFVERLGDSFIAPVLVAYGQVLGASLSTIALFTLMRGLGSILSVMWLPLASDSLGKRAPFIYLSLAVTALAYSFQACSGFWKDSSPQVAVLMICCGRFTAGLFSGLQPLLRAYIAQISCDDPDLQKFRMTMLSLSAQVAGIALAPISGFLATFGLLVPFWAMSIATCVILCFAVRSFREAEDVVSEEGYEALHDTSSTSNGDPHPIRDPRLLLTFFAGFFAMLLLPSVQFLVPLQLAQPCFGLSTEYDSEHLQRHIAKTTGFLMMPHGILTIFTAAVLFMKLTKRVGETAVLFAVSLLAIPAVSSFGFASTVWHLAICSGLMGVVSGLLIPAFGPLLARYASAVHPRRQASMQAIPLFGFYISIAVGQNILAAVLGLFPSQDRATAFKAAWGFCSACMSIAAFLIACFSILVNRALPLTKKVVDDVTSDRPAETIADEDGEISRLIPSELSRHLSSDSIVLMAQAGTPSMQLLPSSSRHLPNRRSESGLAAGLLQQ
eukprot:TRINITY_DN29394_c0_g1_i1.p1 TRINITY_DN29394_c0_g1~~TRINITY_DN29394_c0_g1_i1.p1  ORF type:complete len:515 (-),score=27.02 TRINITY_DN29394_c0_g1_i1:202-1746(-)